MPLALPVSVSGEAVVVAVAAALSWASACDWARVWRKLGPGFLADCAAPFLPFAALLLDWAWFAAPLFWLCELLDALCAWLPDELLLRLAAFLPELRVVWLVSLPLPLPLPSLLRELDDC